MYASIALAALGLTGLVASAPSSTRAVKSRQDSSALNVVYWGQNGGSAEENNDLSYYCQADSDIDIIVLAFLYEFGNGVTTPGGLIGIDCTISTSGEPSSCDAVASSITTCRQAGVKVILSIGGSSDGYSIASQSDAEAMGQYLWDAYGNSGNTTVTRPFGDAVVDGFDFDIEEPNGQEYYQYVISTLRSNFAKDPSNTYYITGAPQCPIPEPNMGVIIGNSTFDYIWIQYYNNNDYQPDPCSLGLPGDAPFNYNQWVDFIATTPSKDAKLFIGAPAGPLAANGGPTGEVYYATPSQLATIIQDTKGNASFGGVMLWSAAASDGNVNDGCTYAQEVKNIFDTGSPCSGSPPTNTLSSMSISQPTSTATAPTSSSTGTVQQWGQCGGEGYSGPTQCVSPYTCKVLSEWYSECE